MEILSLFESDASTIAELSVLFMSFIYIVDSLVEPMPYIKKAFKNLNHRLFKSQAERTLMNSVLVHGNPLGTHAKLSNASKELIRKSVQSKSIRPLFKHAEYSLVGSTYRLRKIANSNKMSNCYAVGQSFNSHNLSIRQ